MKMSESKINPESQAPNFRICKFWPLYIWLLVIVCNLVIGYRNLNLFAQERAADMKKTVMIIAQHNFRDEELLQPKALLERNGIGVKVASASLEPAVGMLGARVNPDLLVSDIDIKDFDALVFIGGTGASQYWDDPLAHQLARSAMSTNRIVAAICIAPVTLARAGVLRGRRATVWPSEAGKLKAKGADYTAIGVERDGNIITASGPAEAKQFAEEILKALSP